MSRKVRHLNNGEIKTIIRTLAGSMGADEKRHLEGWSVHDWMDYWEYNGIKTINPKDIDTYKNAKTAYLIMDSPLHKAMEEE